MLIPLGTDRPNERKPVVTHGIIALNLGVFVLMAVLHNANPDFAEKLGQWGAVWKLDFHVHQLVTSAFLHAGFMHIFGNMIFLLVFGPPVEDRFGRIGFALFYLAGGAGSGLAHIALEAAPAIGASGAVAAVSGAFLVLFPRTRIKCFVLFIFIGIFMIPSWWLIGLFVVLDLFAHVITPANGIANIAHLGGYGFGILTGFVLLGTGILRREPYDLFSILKHRQRRKAFSSASRIHEQSMGRVMRDSRKSAPDPKVQHIATARSEIGALLSEGKADEAADAYLRLIDEFGHDSTAPLTLHRDAQYQVANALYQRGDREHAADAFTRLLSSYPADPERHIIHVLIARTRAEDQADVPGAIVMLEEINEQSLDSDTRAIVEAELERVRSMTTPANKTTPGIIPPQTTQPQTTPPKEDPST